MRINKLLSIIFLLLLPSFAIADANIEKLFVHIKNKEWDIAERIAYNSNDPILRKIVLSQKYLDNNYTNNKFEDIVDFVNKNPNWPGVSKIKKKIENFLTISTNKQSILDWFNHNKPQTTNGYKYYLLSALANNNLTDNQRDNIIKNGLIYGDISLAEEKKYLGDYRKKLTETDYIQRINEYMWRGQIDKAKPFLDLVNKNYRTSAEATIAAINCSASKEALFNKVNKKYYLSSLLYHYLKSKKKEPPTQDAIKLFELIEKDPAHAEEWCKLQQYYAREFIDYKDFTSSYKVIRKHFSANPENIRDSEWLAGWLALRFIKKSDLALSHFKNFNKYATKPISIARGEYWLGRAYAAKGQTSLAKTSYLAASQHPFTFYGQLALIELGENKIIFPPDTKIDTSHREAVQSNEIVRAAKLWLKYGQPNIGHAYVQAAIETAKTPGEIILISEITHADSKLYEKVQIAKTASYSNIFIKDYAYPTPYNLHNMPGDAALSYAIIRQESVFHPSLTSSAGAMGIMQLIKTTACGQAKSMGIKCDVPRLLNDPSYNILLGTNHIKYLLDKRNNSYILAIASYNADPRKVDRWINLFGDPRKMKSMHQIIDWVELIPFHETRNYVQRVLEATQVYRAILKKNNDLTIKKDLGI